MCCMARCQCLEFDFPSSVHVVLMLQDNSHQNCPMNEWMDPRGPVVVNQFEDEPELNDNILSFFHQISLA